MNIYTAFCTSVSRSTSLLASVFMWYLCFHPLNYHQEPPTTLVVAFSYVSVNQSWKEPDVTV